MKSKLYLLLGLIHIDPMHFIYHEPIQGCTKHLEYRLVIDSKWYNLTSQRVHLEDPFLEGKDILENTII